MEKIKVYAKINEQNIITDINSSIFLDSIEGYIQIDEGSGDKYAHAQGNYLDKRLIDESGRFNYKYVNNRLVELTEEEKKELFPIQKEQPTEQEKINAQLLKSNLEFQKALTEQKKVNANLLLQIQALQKKEGNN